MVKPKIRKISGLYILMAIKAKKVNKSKIIYNIIIPKLLLDVNSKR